MIAVNVKALRIQDACVASVSYCDDCWVLKSFCSATKRFRALTVPVQFSSYSKQYGTTNLHPPSCQRPRHNRHCLLVYTTGTTNMVQLEAEKDRWLTRPNDVPVGYMYASIIFLKLKTLTYNLAVVPFGVYAIIQNFNIPIQIQPQIFCMLSLVSWGQILHYNNGWPTWKACLVTTTVGVTFGGVDLLIILTLRPLYLRGVAWPLMIVGIVAAILLAAGLLPPYAELWKRGVRVVGIHFGFLTIDWLEALFSLMGVVMQTTLIRWAAASSSSGTYFPLSLSLGIGC